MIGLSALSNSAWMELTQSELIRTVLATICNCYIRLTGIEYDREVDFPGKHVQEMRLIYCATTKKGNDKVGAILNFLTYNSN